MFIKANHYLGLKICLLILVTVCFGPLTKSALADDGNSTVFDSEACAAYVDWFSPQCSQSYVKQVHGDNATCKASSDDTSSGSYFCYCVNFDDVIYDLYNCDEYLYGNQQFVSFTQFDGQLNDLQKEAYDPAITRSDNIRDYITTVINFALGFLGFVAVIGIIYSGSLYLFSGVSETADKGKEGIKYTIIGLLVIMASYAIVNTVIQAPTGKEEEIIGTGTGQIETTQGTTAFNNDTKDNVIADLGTVSSNLNNVYGLYMKVISPMIPDLEALDPTIADDLQKVNNTLDFIMKSVDQYSETYNSAKSVKDAINVAPSTSFIPDWIEKIYAKPASLCGVDTYDQCITDLNTAISADYQKGMYQMMVEYIDMNSIFVDLDDSNTVKKLYNSILSLPNSTTNPCVYIDYSSLKSCGTQGLMITLTDDPKDSNFVTANDSLNKLQEGVQKIDFVNVKLNASTLKCKAPCTVTFDSLGTIDPSNETVEGLQHFWDLNGNGEYNEIDPFQNGMCNEVPNSSGDAEDGSSNNLVCTYYDSATYIVKLKVNSKYPDKYAPGIATARLIVEPANTESNIVAYSSGAADQQTTKIVYDYIAKPSVKNTVIDFSPADAAAGITFDASKSLGQNNKLINDFELQVDGDKEPMQNGDGKFVYYFPKNANGEVALGTYNLKLILKQGDISDTFPFKVIIKNPNAELNYQAPTDMYVGKTWHFDASTSSIQGKISGYQWLLNSQEIADAKDQTKYDWTPTEPGTYKFTLVVNGQDNNADPVSDNTEVDVTILPEPPVSCFIYDVPDKHNPATYYFDGSCSTGGELTSSQYAWTIDASPDNYVILTEDSAGNPYDTNANQNFLDEQKVAVRFKKLGKYKVTLTVNNGSEGTEQTDTTTGEIMVNNLMDVNAIVYIASVGSTDQTNPPENDSGNSNSYILGNVATLDAPKFGFDLHSLYIAENQDKIDSIDLTVDCGDDGIGKLANSSINDIDWSFDSSTVDYYCNYTVAGTYIVTITISDTDVSKNFNVLTRKLYVAESDKPFPVIKAYDSYSGSEFIPDENNIIYGNKTTTFKFDATASKDVNGESYSANNKNLTFSWTGDDISARTIPVFTKTYDQVSVNNQPYIVNLTLADLNNDSTNKTDLKVLIQEEKPKISNFFIQNVINATNPDDVTTPVQVKLKANVNDIDGQVGKYLWGYIDADNTANGYVASQSSDSSETIMTINNNGDQGKVKHYIFTLVITDDDNNKTGTNNSILEGLNCGATVDSDKSAKSCTLTEPTLDVKNGPNKNPVASFNVDKASIYVGEQVNFDAGSSHDDDGKIIKYTWDFNGNGFYDDETLDYASTSHVFDKVANEGVSIRLQVTDNDNATNISVPVTVYIDALTDPPKAAFVATTSGLIVTFENNSTIDEKVSSSQQTSSSSSLELTNCTWDFDADIDYDGDGNKDNDNQTFDKNSSNDSCQGGTYTYAKPGTYRVKLKVEDSIGSVNSVINYVTVQAVELGGTMMTYDSNDKNKITLGSDNSYHVEATNSVVNFRVTATGGVAPYKYYLDADVNRDSSGNGKTNDDEDYKGDIKDMETVSIDEVKFEPTIASSFDISLLIKDSLGNKFTIKETITIDAEKLTVYLLSDPKANPSDGKIHLTQDKATVIFTPSHKGGLGEIEECFDFNAYYDDDGDGKSDNDCEQINSSYKLTYNSAWGNLKAQYTVIDAKGNKDQTALNIVFDASSTSTVSSNTGILDMFMTPSSQYSKYLSQSDGKIHFTSSPAKISFSFKATGGKVPYQFYFDKNTNFDSDGNGVKDNDANYSYSYSDNNYHDTAVMDFDQSWGNIVVQMKVVDAKGTTDKTTIQIVFDTNKTAFDISNIYADIFNLNEINLVIFFEVLGGFGILILALYLGKRQSKE